MYTRIERLCVIVASILGSVFALRIDPASAQNVTKRLGDGGRETDLLKNVILFTNISKANNASMVAKIGKPGFIYRRPYEYIMSQRVPWELGKQPASSKQNHRR
ncbi:uncharacterized protein BDZ83DRAFT_645232 [Colletotrichum acutatum]|uniref:Uncharacterized protein n=1 Tax=Glomerella acutata TaxID=27357 RepID=A0AAD8U4E3_GLOAC|nr:uncharacterized protein BDZ83DRAFT_645232 [Colletotrichum acutatum]KAK1702627.1 hypothetical protein BDZ83DRAFT_645232 [Colletotrichum acutatum]